MASYKINADTYIGNSGKTLALVANGIIEEIYESTDGRYIKYSNGIMIQTKRVYVNISFNVWYESIAYADFNMGAWLTPFKSGNMIVLVGDSIQMSGNNQAWPCSAPDNMTTTQAGTFRCLRTNDAGGAPTYKWTAYLYRTAIGFWK